MDQNQPEQTIEESMKEVMQMLPPPVRDYLASGKYSLVARDLTAKYGLHIDQGGVLEREIMLLLMGIENPSEFIATLTSEAAIPEPTVRDIMPEINQKIFVPLQEEMRKGVQLLGQQPPQIPTSPFVPRPMMPRPVNAPVPSYAPPRPSVASSGVGPHPSPKATEGIARPPVVPVQPAATPNTGETKQPSTYFHLENKLPAPRPPLGATGGATHRPMQSPTAASALSMLVPPLPQQPPRPAVASGVVGPRPMPAQPVVKAEEKPSTLAQAIGNALKEEPKVAQQSSAPVRPPIFNSAPLPPKMTMPHPSLKATEGIARSVMATQKPVEDSSKLLEDHEEPSPSLKAAPVPPKPTQDVAESAGRIYHSPLPRPSLKATEGTAKTESPPVNLPGAMPPVVVPDAEVQAPSIQPLRPAVAFSEGGMPAWPEPVTPSVPAAPIAPIAPKASSSDPYREPIE